MPLKPRFLQKLRFGVRQRVVLTLLGGLLISLTINAWLSIQEQERFTNEEINRKGTQFSQLIAQSLANSVIGYDYHGIQLFIGEVIKGDIDFVKVISRKGNVMAETEKARLNLKALRIFNTDILLEGSVVGHLEIGLNTDSIIDQVEAQKESLVSREAGVIIFILIIEFIALSILIVRPLSRISEALSQNSENSGVLPAEIKIESRDEFGDIATLFNQIRTQLNKAHQALQGKIDIADRKLRVANKKLLKKSQLLEESNKELKNQAVTDPLTGLYNRRKFQHLIKHDIDERLKADEILSLLIADIDYFKNINDKFGHDIGDQVLEEIALQLSENVRKSDVLCRIGGEEFAILCYQAGPEDAFNIAEKIRKAVESATICVEEANLNVTLSIGIATPGIGAHLHCPDCLYRQADIALYQSKATGRNKVTHFYEVDLDEINGLDMEILNEKHSA